MTVVRVGTFENLKAELEKDAEFRKADRQIKPYYDLLIEIIRRRSQLNITQEELAERAGMQQSSIARLESAEHNARLDTIIKIAEALDAHLEIHLVPNYHIAYIPLFSTGAFTPPSDYLSKPSQEIESGVTPRVLEPVYA